MSPAIYKQRVLPVQFSCSALYPVPHLGDARLRSATARGVLDVATVPVPRERQRLKAKPARQQRPNFNAADRACCDLLKHALENGTQNGVC